MWGKRARGLFACHLLPHPSPALKKIWWRAAVATTSPCRGIYLRNERPRRCHAARGGRRELLELQWPPPAARPRAGSVSWVVSCTKVRRRARPKSPPTIIGELERIYPSADLMRVCHVLDDAYENMRKFKFSPCPPMGRLPTPVFVSPCVHVSVLRPPTPHLIPADAATAAGTS